MKVGSVFFFFFTQSYTAKKKKEKEKKKAVVSKNLFLWQLAKSSVYIKLCLKAKLNLLDAFFSLSFFLSYDYVICVFENAHLKALLFSFPSSFLSLPFPYPKPPPISFLLFSPYVVQFLSGRCLMFQGKLGRMMPRYIWEVRSRSCFDANDGWVAKAKNARWPD